MSNLVKEKITTNLEKAKGEGKMRAEHIREIVKDAVLQTVSELQEGSSEIRLIVKDAISTVISDLKDNEKENTEKITASIEGAIEGGTYQRQLAIAQRRARLLEIQAQLDEQQQQLDREISDVLIDIKASESADFIDDNSAAINLAVDTVQERQASGLLEEQYLKLKAKLASLDVKLALRYGDRYNQVKQQWDNAKTWYDQKKTEAETSGTIPLQQKQLEIEQNLGDLGSVVARKEKEIKQNLQERWEDKISGSKH
ncbi:MAG: histidine kinase [Pseudanabaena frigida]|uniref:Histidine kinase n=1 Tax=Pseudanabaena frigida TaxID=945775 RepID=A0A2W4W672_9CYAN|nr:MAG: histidine kinase [Pseudanabaena frigida]